MPTPTEGYVLHSYGPERYVRHAVASVTTIRRYDAHRPVALYCPPSHRTVLEREGLDDLFAVIDTLPAAHRSIVGFKHHLHAFKPFDRSLYVDADMIWCRDPDPLWKQLRAFPFTATGQERADFFFGGPKGAGVVIDFLLNRRRRTLDHFGLTHLPRVQAGMIYAQDDDLTREVCEQAQHYLSRSDETHFRSRMNEGRHEESCEWSLAMAMSRYDLPIFPWMQGHNSPQLDFIEGMARHDAEFHDVACRYYSNAFIYSLRGLPSPGLRDTLINILTRIPGRGDYKEVTPYALHFGWLHHKQPFYDFAQRTWTRLLRESRRIPLSTNGDGAAHSDPQTEPTPAAEYASN